MRKLKKLALVVILTFIFVGNVDVLADGTSKKQFTFSAKIDENTIITVERDIAVNQINRNLSKNINTNMYTYNGITKIYSYPSDDLLVSKEVSQITMSTKVWAYANYENGYTLVEYNNIKGYIQTSKLSETNPNENEIDMLVKQAIKMASDAKIKYGQDERQTASTIEGLNSLSKTDCSAYVYSMFKTYLKIDVNAQSESILSKGESGYVENGWKAEVIYFNGDTSVLKPGDILYRPGHVGIYVGNGLQVDHGGPGSANPSDSDPWRGPLKKEVSSRYTKAIRYSKV